MMQEMVNYIYANTVQDSTKLHIIKDPKPKFPAGACLRTPPPTQFATRFAHGYILAPCNLILPTLGAKKLKDFLLSLLYIGWRQHPLLPVDLRFADRFLFPICDFWLGERLSMEL